MNNEKLAEFLSNHKYNCENFNEEGNYDPNPYWLADEIVEFLNLQNVSESASDAFDRGFSAGYDAGVKVMKA